MAIAAARQGHSTVLRLMDPDNGHFLFDDAILNRLISRVPRCGPEPHVLTAAETMIKPTKAQKFKRKPSATNSKDRRRNRELL